jgi:hypothetical protein
MHKSATKCNKTIGKWCKNKHGASKIIDTLETYQVPSKNVKPPRSKSIPWQKETFQDPTKCIAMRREIV